MPTLIPDFYLVQSCLYTFQFYKNNIPNKASYCYISIYIYIHILSTNNLYSKFKKVIKNLPHNPLHLWFWWFTTQNVPHNTCCLFSKKSFCLLVLAKQMTLASSLRPLRICHNLSSFLGEVAPPGWLAEVWFGCYISIHFEHIRHQQTWSIVIW